MAKKTKRPVAIWASVGILSLYTVLFFVLPFLFPEDQESAKSSEWGWEELALDALFYLSGVVCWVETIILIFRRKGAARWVLLAGTVVFAIVSAYDANLLSPSVAFIDGWTAFGFFLAFGIAFGPLILVFCLISFGTSTNAYFENTGKVDSEDDNFGPPPPPEF